VVLHFLGWFTGVTADLGPNSPGANDNASGAATLLTLAERLRSEPLQHTEVWLAFTGCEEVGAEGMAVLLDEYGSQLKGAIFLDFELVGIGDRLIYVRHEGIVRRRRISPKVEALLHETSHPYGIQPVGIAGIGALTEIGVALERGFEGACVMSRRSTSPFMPEWHRLTDTPDKLEPAALERAQELGWKLLQMMDEGQE
jgi:Zn-dependent M28 family amino/carboxypeptidase